MDDHTTDDQAYAEAYLAQQSQVRQQADTLMAVVWQTIRNGSINEREARIFFGYLLEKWGLSRPPEPLPVPNKRKEMARTLRREVFERDAYRCVLCGDWHDLHLDHIYPVVHGGQNTADNLRVLCRVCNQQKGARI